MGEAKRRKNIEGDRYGSREAWEDREILKGFQHFKRILQQAIADPSSAYVCCVLGDRGFTESMRDRLIQMVCAPLNSDRALLLLFISKDEAIQRSETDCEGWALFPSMGQTVPIETSLSALSSDIESVRASQRASRTADLN